MTGWLSGIPGTSGDAAQPPKDAALADRVAEAAAWLAQFRELEQLVSFLMDVQDGKDRRGFLVPANLPLKLITYAFLLAADDSPQAPTVAERAIAAASPRGDALVQTPARWRPVHRRGPRLPLAIAVETSGIGSVDAYGSAVDGSAPPGRAGPCLWHLHRAR